MKIDKIEKEMQRTREKITDLQNRLKDLAAQKTEQENLQIIQIVRSLDISHHDLKDFLSDNAALRHYPAQTEQPTPAPAVTGAAGYYDDTTEQEGSDDEEE